MAEIHQGGPLAHQLPLHNHRGGLVQPSLVMNHRHLDMDCHQTGLEIHAANISKCPKTSEHPKSPGEKLFDRNYFCALFQKARHILRAEKL